ncbi:MAG TPA: beta-ketoacyl-ACP synthase II [Candidatus Fimimorpha excrementavium]|nr:beta-ketoacyl-ACP synthase II [Candidatus Fimimorpha excrementavium]
MKRVVVTGLGAITPIGNSVEEFWNGIKEQKVGIGPITKFDTEGYKVHIAAEVKGFAAKEYMDVKASRRMELFSQYVVAATKEALADAGIDMEKEDPFRVGVSVGSGIGSLQAMEREHEKLLTKGPNRVNPLLVPLMICNMAAGNVGIQFGLRGKNINVVTACATGTHSIGEAFRSIQHGEADVMVAGGTESSITPIGVAGFAALTALTEQEDVSRASIPFDKERSGFVMGEGAGVVVLESLEHAKARGAKIYAELVGYGATCDAYHITSPIEDGSGAARAMTEAIKDAGISPDEVDYVNAHGTSTHHNDLFETKAIKLALGDHAYDVKVNSTKSMIGHLLGAAGGVEFITCVKSIEEGYIHPTVGYQVPDEECDLDYVTNGPVQMDVRYAISNSLGFGGHNASLLVKKYED